MSLLSSDGCAGWVMRGTEDFRCLCSSPCSNRGRRILHGDHGKGCLEFVDTQPTRERTSRNLIELRGRHRLQQGSVKTKNVTGKQSEIHARHKVGAGDVEY